MRNCMGDLRNKFNKLDSGPQVLILFVLAVFIFAAGVKVGQALAG